MPSNSLGESPAPPPCSHSFGAPTVIYYVGKKEKRKEKNQARMSASVLKQDEKKSAVDLLESGE